MFEESKNRGTETPFRDILFEWALVFLLGAIPFSAMILKEAGSWLESIGMGLFGGAVVFILFTIAGSE